MSDQELAEVFADSDEENHNEFPAGETLINILKKQKTKTDPVTLTRLFGPHIKVTTHKRTDCQWNCLLCQCPSAAGRE